MFEQVHYTLYADEEELPYKFYTINHVKRWLLKNLDYIESDLYIIEHRRKLEPPNWIDKKKCKVGK